MDTKKFWGDGLLPRGAITSWMPYGRLGSSVLKTIDSPSMLIENFTGLPTHRIDRFMKKSRKDAPDISRFSPLLQLLSTGEGEE
jgi:hypothetical protein